MKSLGKLTDHKFHLSLQSMRLCGWIAILLMVMGNVSDRAFAASFTKSKRISTSTPAPIEPVGKSAKMTATEVEPSFLVTFNATNEEQLNNRSLNISFSNFHSFQRAYKKALAMDKGQKEQSLKGAIEKYRLALASLLQNRPQMALEILPTATTFQKLKLPLDRLFLTMGRAHYQNQNYPAAIDAYSKIPQNSDLWLVAIEERAHAQGRAKNYEKSIADLTTLFSPVFENVLGPEAYFTAGLTYLRLCQYGKVFDFLKRFKAQMKKRVTDLTALTEGKGNDLILSAVHDLQFHPYRSLSYAKQAPQLPLLFHLDFTVRDQIKNLSRGGSEKVDFLPPALLTRIQQLAQQDLSEIKSHLTKMQLIEAEVMQRLHLVENAKGNKRQKMGKFEAKKDQLFFPFDGEVWIDELDSYQVQSKSCPKEGGGA